MFLLARIFSLSELYLRAFSSTTVATAKTGHFLHKLIAKSKARIPNPYAYAPHDPGVPSAPRKPQEITQRQKVLNAVFMENISNIMFVGEIGERLQDCGIELTEVRVSADCTHLNVYWVTSLDLPGINEKISKLLMSCCGLLRSELISCQFMGRVPRITFVHDATYRRAREIEQFINRVSLEIPQEEQECSELDFHCSAKTENKNVEEQKSETDLMQLRPTPQGPCDMRMNIFGLDHAAFMREITAKKKRTHGTLQNTKSTECVSSASSTSAAVQRSMVMEFVQLQKQKAALSRKPEQEAQKSLCMFHGDDGVKQTPETSDSLQAVHCVEPEDEYDEDDVTKISYINDQSHTG